MNSLDQQARRDEALELRAQNPASQAFVPDEPDPGQMIQDLAQQLVEDCAELKNAKLYADAYELFVNDQPEILQLVGQCFYECHTHLWKREERRDRLAILGQAVTDLIMRRMEVIAQKEIEA